MEDCDIIMEKEEKENALGRHRFIDIQRMGERSLHSNTLVNGNLASSHCISTKIK